MTSYKLWTAGLLGLVSLFFYTEKTQRQIFTNNSYALSEKPDSTRFSYSTLASGFDEPMQMAILPNYDVLVAERKGALRLYNAKDKKLSTVAHLNVFSGIEDGLLGVAADPDYEKNNWIYLYYGLGGDKHVSELSRFVYREGKLDMTSKKVLLEIPTQRTYCCHSAGYLTFDSKGLLYLSTGDNTNAEEIEGHNPTDERPGRQLSDGQATSANTNDLRGKILRIKPEPDGTYSIPDGNLFAKNDPKARPEIYVMGCRNPFRMSVDPKNGFVYWGDVGPDTEIPAQEGKLSYDEINQARQPGFFGYPYFLGANEIFPKYDFETKKEGPGKDPAHPVNNSPNNTGLNNLPAAQPAFIWYGKGPSKNWPMVDRGGASAMAGPVYYRDFYPDAPYKLPQYYNGKLLIYDWIRKWMMAVTMDEKGNYVSMEPFLPQLHVVAPMDMQIARDGAIYMLAYGTNWFAKNTDSGIIRVEYSEGNRRPIAVASISESVGAAPLKVKLSASGSKDFDQGDQLMYSWTVGNLKMKGHDVTHTFTKPGIYDVLLTVTDSKGAGSTTTSQIKVGNQPPKVTIATSANQSFYWDNSELDYKITISDKEDNPIAKGRVKTAFNYLPFGKDLASVLSSGSEDVRYAQTKKLYLSLDCKACHTMETKSIGPSLKAIATKYAGNKSAGAILADKILKGGSGNWGSYPMPPHPDLSLDQATEITSYILHLKDKQSRLPLQGKLALSEHIGKGNEGAYVLQASYTDAGTKAMAPLSASKHIVLRSPQIEMEDYSEGNVGVVIATLNTGYVSYLSNIRNGKYVRYDDIDLTKISSIRLWVQKHGAGGRISVRSNAMNGIEIGSIDIEKGQISDLKTGWQQVVIPLKPSPGKQNVYFVFSNQNSANPMFHLDKMLFERKVN
ncbi:PQQ-dependent sugar dehydrogenase [Dyadobacter sp. CY312]|uniref:PQQ-dependent sugar dehydrogenase n=1 Tax=Dyadobacter sp. CY312 TaxID=2907303 RepID=UPI001F2F9652|nr:PQQ-dependent sugar dehydrogenase [Dyadobacter sp. CY312]MCE7040388.1 PQQ-dependent sugar dehydrogenase [Dyadobacter sp. CY312]